MFNKFENYAKTGSLSIANRDEKIIAVLSGSTVGEIGKRYALDAEDFEFDEKEVTVGSKTYNIRNMYVNLLDREWSIGVSKGFNWDQALDDEDFLLNCEFYATHVALKAEDGTVVMDDVTNRPVLLDGEGGRELRKQIILGNPTIIEKSDNVRKAFAAQTKEELRQKKSLLRSKVGG